MINKQRAENLISEHGNIFEIRALYNDETIRVYQAYNKTIAEEAVKNGTFGSHFSLNRMTWIKPSFLWMMYRCGWAQKENQEHVLAIDIKRSDFDKAVNNAVCSTYSENMGISKEEWQKQIADSDIRVQWDPEKDIYGNDLPYRSIQIGLRRDAVKDYVYNWIVKITDITDYVNELYTLRNSNENIYERLPKEIIYKMSSESAVPFGGFTPQQQ
jgi:hypothetical protein